jgi:hypothetical protein
MLFHKDKTTLEQARLISEESGTYLNKIRPIVTTNHHHIALHLMGQGLSVFMEMVWYALGILSFAFTFIMNAVFPFYVLGEVVAKKALRDMVATPGDIDTFHWAVKGLVLLIGILFIALGLSRRSARLRNATLQNSLHELKQVQDYFQAKKDAADRVIADAVEKAEKEAAKTPPPPQP